MFLRLRLHSAQATLEVIPGSNTPRQRVVFTIRQFAQKRHPYPKPAQAELFDDPGQR
jgi:hypothetical protein